MVITQAAPGAWFPELSKDVAPGSDLGKDFMATI
jgi:hypothetical protein